MPALSIRFWPALRAPARIGSPMRCDFCNKPAVVHEMTVKNGIKKEVHLCQDHALEAGIELPQHQPISKLLAQMNISQSMIKPRAERKVCPNCNLSFATFRKKGILGCPECYRAFEDLLETLIERAQNGATHHCGKTPQRAGISLDRQLIIQKLIKELDNAVSAEQYERAAELRDQINTLEVAGPAESGD